jgi:predicted TIM-barrel fold metal-dependent hydrolase
MSRKIDSHVHLWRPADIDNLEAIRQRLGFDRMNIASVARKDSINDNPALYAAKAAHPDSFYVFAALDHSAHWSGGKIASPSLAEQVDRAVAIGVDGIKLIETKPTHRKMVDFPIDGDYYAPMFAPIEQTGLPILWHVADPEEFWDPQRTPGWAKARGWGYDQTWIAKETLCAEVENVLRRHPRLKVILAHFYFLSADLARAAALFDAHPQVCFDLAPGVEMLYNLSRDPDSAREFFIKHADRIVFGTDIEAGAPVEQAAIRAQIVMRWLETDHEFRLDKGADYTLGPPTDGAIRGLNLPQDVLAAIYAANFERLAGSRPKPLNKALALEECRRIAAEVIALGGEAAIATEAVCALTPNLSPGRGGLTA